MNKLCILSLLLAVGACGCTMIPRYQRPEPPVPAAWPSAAAPGSSATNAPAAADVDWREVVTDERLRQVIERALSRSRDLRLAVLAVERARALYGIQRAELLPALNLTAVGSKSGTARSFGADEQAASSEHYAVNLGIASWEIDFFGRIRSLKRRALEQFLATEQARRGARIALISSVASAYFTLAADRETLALARTTLEAHRSSYELIKRGYDLGLVPETDLQRVLTQVEAARSDVARFTQRVAQDGNALALLVGEPVPEDLLPAALADVAAPREVQPGIPSDVLLRRPDVLQAESLLRAANADIGAARAAFFPRIALTAAWGTTSSELSGLFAAGSDTWSIAPSAVLPVLDARVWSARRAAGVSYEIAATRYEQTLQIAFREVADVLAVQATIDEQVAAQEALVASTDRTYQLSRARYDRGIDSYLNVLDAQRSLYAAQQVLVSSRFVKLANRIQLYGALGGGGGVE